MLFNFNLKRPAGHRSGGATLERPTAVFLFALFAFHAAAYALPGRAYFHLVGLSDALDPVRPNVLLHPAFVLCALYGMYRTLGTVKPARPRLDVMTVALGAWCVAATFSGIAHFDTDGVLLTYVVVFLAGAVVYVTLSRVPVSDSTVDVAILGMMAGALFPLLGGILAYVREWGTPDWNILLGATLDLARMQPYEEATFGNRGNTAAFLMIAGPPLLWLALDGTRSRSRRLLYASLLVPVGINLLLIQVRAAMITALMISALIWRFRTGSRLAYIAFCGSAAIAIAALFASAPEVREVLGDRFETLLTLDTGKDASLQGRTDAMSEGIDIAEKNWLLGVGPGAALTVHSQTSAHQLHIQQGMETGILGFVGVVIGTIALFAGVWLTLGRSIDPDTRVRFGLLIGPAAFLLYGAMANLTLSVGYVNTWAVLAVALVALARPRLTPRTSVAVQHQHELPAGHRAAARQLATGHR